MLNVVKVEKTIYKIVLWYYPIFEKWNGHTHSMYVYTYTCKLKDCTPEYYDYLQLEELWVIFFGLSLVFIFFYWTCYCILCWDPRRTEL